MILTLYSKCLALNVCIVVHGKRDWTWAVGGGPPEHYDHHDISSRAGDGCMFDLRFGVGIKTNLALELVGMDLTRHRCQCRLGSQAMEMYCASDLLGPK